MKKVTIAQILVIIVSFVIAIMFYDSMPEQMASHWNTLGEVDGYMPKFWGLFIMPLVSSFIFLLFLIIPKIDPLKENIKKFRTYFDTFILLILVFLFYIYLLSISWNLGYIFDMNLMILPALSILFYFIGVLLSKAKRNWFIGIRTPWTLSSDVVWDKTHKLGGKLFKILSLIILSGIFFGEDMIYFILVPVIVFTVYLIIYSYVEYKKL